MTKIPSQNRTNPQLAEQLLAASIHEIKNRFGLMFSQLDELLGALSLGPDQMQLAELLKSEGQFIGSELVRVLASYKSLTREQDRAAVSPDQHYLLDVLEEKVARHASTARAHQLQLEFECDDDLDGFFDAGLLSIVLDTAIYNAVQAGARHILLCAQQKADHLRIDIHDNGPGFPDSFLETQPQVQQVHPLPSQSSTGLGLYFARRLMAEQGEADRCGSLIVGVSDRLGGACLSLILPQ